MEKTKKKKSNHTIFMQREHDFDKKKFSGWNYLNNTKKIVNFLSVRRKSEFDHTEMQSTIDHFQAQYSVNFFEILTFLTMCQ